MDWKLIDQSYNLAALFNVLDIKKPTHRDVAVYGGLFDMSIAKEPETLVVPIPKEDSFELLSINAEVNMGLKPENKIDPFDKAMIEFIGRPILYKEPIHIYSKESNPKPIPIILFYKCIINEVRMIKTLDVWVRGEDIKEILEQSQAYYFNRPLANKKT